jgi:hypothetical protein
MPCAIDSFDSEQEFSSFRRAVLTRHEEAQVAVQTCKHRIFTKLAASVLGPLLSAVEKMENTSSQEMVSLGSIYIGLLCFHLSLPASPLDPGKKPSAKVVQWDQHLRDLGSKLVTIRMEAGHVTGNFEPDNDEVTSLVNSLSHGYTKRSKQEKKRVERPSIVPPFYELFREVHHFASTVASADNILGLVQAI